MCRCVLTERRPCSATITDGCRNHGIRQIWWVLASVSAGTPCTWLPSFPPSWSFSSTYSSNKNVYGYVASKHSNKTSSLSLLSSSSRLGPLTSTDSTSLEISRFGVVVRENRQPFASWAIRGTFPRAIKRGVDLALYSFICWGVLPMPGYVIKQAVESSDN